MSESEKPVFPLLGIRFSVYRGCLINLEEQAEARCTRRHADRWGSSPVLPC